MKYSNKINLDDFLFALSDQIYCIIKISKDFPNYFQGNDIDIFCYNLPEFAQKILEVGQTYVQIGFEIKFKSGKQYQHSAIDFYLNDILDFRFDLHQELPIYEKLSIKSGLFSSVIENAVPVERQYKKQKYNIYVPSEVDDMLLRYLEYMEWYHARPDKLKHLDYIINNLKDNTDRIKLLDKLHYYTKIPEVNYKDELNPGLSAMEALRTVPSAIRQLKSKPISEIPSTIVIMLKKLKNI